jgi:hypothetical protein
MAKKSAAGAPWVALAVLTVLVGSSDHARAQARYVSQVRAQLNMLEVLARAVGYQRTHEYTIGSLGRAGRDSFTITLRRGVRYRLASVCDNDCRDIDIALYDENDHLIDVDLLDGDVPIIEVAPAWTGPFRVDVHMAGCSSWPCYYGIGVFGR